MEINHNTALAAAVKVAFTHQVNSELAYQTPHTHTTDALADLVTLLDLDGYSASLFNRTVAEVPLDALYAIADLSEKATMADSIVLSDFYYELADELLDLI